MDSFEQGSEIKSPKLFTKYQNDSKAEFTGSPSETESDSDSAEEIECEDKISARSVIYSSESSQKPIWQTAKSIMKSHRKFLVSNICHNEFIVYIRKFTIVNILS